MAKKVTQQQKNQKELNKIFYRTVSSGAFYTANILVEAGADVNFRRNKNCFPAIFYPIGTGNMQYVQYLLSKGASLSTVTENVHLYSVLHYCIYTRRPEMLEFFLQQGLDVNLKTNEGVTPLALAVWSSNSTWQKEQMIKCVKVLMRFGANIHENSAAHCFGYHDVEKTIAAQVYKNNDMELKTILKV